MSGFLDTSVIVCYFTGDPPELAETAAHIIDSEEELLITDVVLVETAYVLTSVYRIPHSVVIEHLMSFFQKANIAPFALDKPLVLHALLLCKPSARISFADAIVWAAARSMEHPKIYSFDSRFPREGLDVQPSP